MVKQNTSLTIRNLDLFVRSSLVTWPDFEEIKNVTYFHTFTHLCLFDWNYLSHNVYFWQNCEYIFDSFKIYFDSDYKRSVILKWTNKHIFSCKLIWYLKKYRIETLDICVCVVLMKCGSSWSLLIYYIQQESSKPHFTEYLLCKCSAMTFCF